MVWGLLTFLCSYGEKTLNLKWFVLSLTTLIILMPMIMKIFNDDVIVDKNPLGDPLSLGWDCISRNNIINYYSHDQNYYHKQCFCLSVR